MKLAMLLLVTLIATRPVHSTELQHSVGIGLQYSGLIGYQLSTSLSQGRIRGSIGLVGVSLGYDHYITETFSFGATYTKSLRTVYSVNLSYMPKGLRNSGWLIALDLGHMPDDDAEGFFRTDGTKNVVWLSAGYQF
ncbi:hypothetical protein [Aliiglaciecola litoralis]|uniref:Outer membrane protein beta-barrel domain-containing protein n=1 Tax=Aliiglaciecola litoralis TaxID=582857 RepID=A0ABP3X2P4_9ALTE